MSPVISVKEHVKAFKMVANGHSKSDRYLESPAKNKRLSPINTFAVETNDGDENGLPNPSPSGCQGCCKGCHGCANCSKTITGFIEQCFER